RWVPQKKGSAKKQKQDYVQQEASPCKHWHFPKVRARANYRSISPTGVVHADSVRWFTREGYYYDEGVIAVMQHVARKRLGRKPNYHRAMTDAERQRKRRAPKDKPFVLDDGDGDGDGVGICP